LPKVHPSSSSIADLLTAGCHRNVPAELQYDSPDGTVVVGRIRLLAWTDRHLLTDAPVYTEGDQPIPRGAHVTVHVQVNGKRLRFSSRIEEDRLQVPLNSRQKVPGMALALPTTIRESQRREHFRISLAGCGPVIVDLAAAAPNVPDACDLAVGVMRGRLIDLSAGGISVSVDRRAAHDVAIGQRLFVSFQLPGVEERFDMLGAVRHRRRVVQSESVRLGLSFRAWGDQSLQAAQSRLTRFITEHERRLLRRRK